MVVGLRIEEPESIPSKLQYLQFTVSTLFFCEDIICGSEESSVPTAVLFNVVSQVGDVDENVGGGMEHSGGDWSDASSRSEPC